MGVEQVFNVLTEFRFDIAHAVSGSKELQGSIGKISTAADEAHFAIQRIGMGLVAQTGLGSGGILGGLYAAIKAADKFESTQRKMANVLLSNQVFTGPGAFAAAMKSADESLQNMNKVANQFSLPSEELVNFSNLVGATLVAHGLDNAKFEKSTNLSRGFLKSAPTLGIDPNLAQGQLLDAVMGRANMGDTLFQRISNETSAMKPYQGTAGAKAFNALDPAKRLDVLTKSLTQFGSIVEITDANAQSLSAQMQRFKDNLVGIFSILRPIGKAIMDPLRKILYQMNVFIERDGKMIGETLGRVFTDIFKDPEKLFVNIQQIRRLQGDVKKAGNLLALIGLVHGLTMALRFFGVTLSGGLFMTGLRMLGSGIAYIGRFVAASGAVGFIFQTLGFIATKILAPLALVTMLFQGLSNGLAKAQLINAKWVADNLARITLAFENFKNTMSRLFAPITYAIEGLGDIFAIIFRLDLTGGALLTVFEALNAVIEVFARTIIKLMAILSGFTNAIIGWMVNLTKGNFSQLGKMDLMKNFQEGREDLWYKFYPKQVTDESGQATAQTKIDIEKIEINNQFKENAEPDRIAFTLKDQLLKAALNPTQAAGRSLQGAGNVGF